jgi:hypothetical protein
MDFPQALLLSAIYMMKPLFWLWPNPFSWPLLSIKCGLREDGDLLDHLKNIKHRNNCINEVVYTASLDKHQFSKHDFYKNEKAISCLLTEAVSTQLTALYIWYQFPDLL